MAARAEERPRHETRVSYGSGRFEVECYACGLLAPADAEEEPQAISRLHEGLVAVLVERWAIPH